MSALEPSSGLLGKEYVKETEAESDHHLHLLAGPGRDDTLDRTREKQASLAIGKVKNGRGVQAAG